MEFFIKIVNSFFSLTIFAKGSDVSQGPKYVSETGTLWTSNIGPTSVQWIEITTQKKLWKKPELLYLILQHLTQLQWLRARISFNLHCLISEVLSFEPKKAQQKPWTNLKKVLISLRQETKLKYQANCNESWRKGCDRWKIQ